MADLYNQNPTVTHTLRQFISRAYNLWEKQDQHAFSKFVLTGEYADHLGRDRQVFLDPVQNRVRDVHGLIISRDYDSAIGISDRILVNAPITAFAVPHPTFSLTSSIHITHTVMDGERLRDVEYHHIPNFEFAHFGNRHQINIFFTKLWKPETEHHRQPSHISEEKRAFWYEYGLRPAIEALSGDAIVSQWPASYEAEKIRAKRTNGGYAWSTRVISKDVVPRLADAIRTCLVDNPDINDDDIIWATDFFFVHTIRGVKHGNYHRADGEAANYFLSDFLNDAQLSTEAGEFGKWYIDVGVEIASKERECLQWLTAAHRKVVEQALRIPTHHAERITQINSSKYSRDLSSHLTAVSGFRIVPGIRAQGPFEAAYLQAYTTDKSVVYHPQGGHHAKFLTAKEILGSAEHPTPTVDGIHHIYDKALLANSSNARLEVRVPIRFATEVFLNIDPAVIREALCSFTREEWWKFRITRLMGMAQTFALQAQGPTSLRFSHDTLLLTAACVWLINGLHARPEDGPASRKLMDAVLPVTEAAGANPNVLAYKTSVRAPWQHEEEESASDDDDVRRVPYNPYGCVFLRRIAIGSWDVPRLRVGGPSIPGPTFEYWFGTDHSRLKAKYQTSGFIDRNTISESRSTTNKARYLPLYVNFTGEPEPNLFNFGNRGRSLPSPAPDDGSDLEDRPSHLLEGGPQTIDDELSMLWRQFVSDLTSKSPNQRGITNPSYLKLNNVERQSGSEDPYKTLHLSDVFTAVHYKTASREEWLRSFDWLFPKSGQPTSTAVQNYRQSPYYKQWADLAERTRSNPKLFKEIRDGMWERIRTWTWMPNAQVDKMWPTSVRPGGKFTRWPATPQPRPAPHILLKSGVRPTFDDPPVNNGDDGGN
ncbi:hypothetical protein P691DRAFT_781765 [Macrolepiota fuliginosa MF-IS2]|uniref:Uncharacterized protein n=1 Tax=Macrolepiota fuliginosa MF-IS2 TaxID=1400762 RepID=A0A9P5XE77_9AGAR|nr:hypothetical protein P691DRAFT_781765 [Macrolepiota fuliginosa MF-IS2]